MTRRPPRCSRVSVLPLVLTLALAVSAPAVAHVQVELAGDPAAAKVGEVVIGVESEEPAAHTVSVQVKLPDNVIQAEFPQVDGWRSSGATEPLSPPLEVDGTVRSTRISTVTWTGDLAPGKRAELRLRVRVRQGTPLTGLAFPAVQRYSDGTVVRWIGPPGSDTPAGVLAGAVPVAVVTPASEPPSQPEVNPGTTPAATTSRETIPPDDSLVAWTVATIGGVIVVFAGLAIWLRRRARSKHP
jgi:periplasmic copper chaperone A